MPRISTKFVFLCLVFIFTVSGVRAEDQAARYFSSVKVYADREYVLNDVVEFALFDMSEATILDGDLPAPIVPAPAANKTTVKSTGTTAAANPMNIDVSVGLGELRPEFAKLPKTFYAALKGEILDNAVPVTLYATKIPSYAKPLALSIKVKTIRVGQPFRDKLLNEAQTVAVKIFGELTDKKSGELILRFYDVAQTDLSTGKDEAKIVLEKISQELMQHLALYLKTKY